MADWFTSLAQQAFKLADDLADSIVQQANEAQQQLQHEQQKLQEEIHQEQERLYSSGHLLPWETNVESRQILSQDLMERILALSVHENNFTLPSANKHEVQFSFQEFVPIAMRVLQIDSNLARLHAKLSPKMDEEVFWFNYYCRIVYLRACSGIDGVEAQNAVNKWKESDILKVDAVKVVPVVSSTTNLGPSTASQASSSSRSNVDPSPVQNKFITPAKGSDKSNSSPLLDNSFDSININTPNKTISPIAPSTVDKNSSAVKKITADDGDDIILDDLDLELEENLKDLDILDELDDIDPSDYEKIGSSEFNDELEAQIAKELGEDI